MDEQAPEPLRADIGAHVAIELVTEEGRERLEFDIVPDEQADFARGFLGAGTSLARALLGKQAGERIPYTQGDSREIRIVSIAASTAAPPADVQARRQETLRKAIDQSDRTNAMIFASSFSGKWGDYDPTGFTEEPPASETEDDDEAG